MPRDTRLTLWPEQVSFFPLSNSWSAIERTDTLDFSHVREVRSCGLAATLLNLKWLFHNKDAENHKNNVRQSDLFDDKEIRLIDSIFENTDKTVMEICESLGFFESIKDYLSDRMQSKYCKNINVSSVNLPNDEFLHPIHILKYTKCKSIRIDMVKFFYGYSCKIIDDFFCDSNKSSQLLLVLEEIVKNIADHAQADGVIGVDVSRVRGQKILSILIGDTGPGIYTHLRNIYLKKKPERAPNTGFSEVYKKALENGFSSADSSENYGLGMSTIINNCIALNAHISVFDQSTRLVLSSLDPIDEIAPSYNRLWDASFRFDGKKPFFYFIQCGE